MHRGYWDVGVNVVVDDVNIEVDNVSIVDIVVVEIDGDNVVDSVVYVMRCYWYCEKIEVLKKPDWLCDWQKVTTREAIASNNSTGCPAKH